MLIFRGVDWHEMIALIWGRKQTSSGLSFSSGFSGSVGCSCVSCVDIFLGGSGGCSWCPVIETFETFLCRIKHVILKGKPFNRARNGGYFVFGRIYWIYNI